MPDSETPKRWFDHLGLGAELQPAERREVLEGLFALGRANQKPFLRRMWVLLVLSTIIATSGLLSDSAAVVIGAMLVAPMMRPVMAAAAAITLAWPRRFFESIALVIGMAVAAIAIAMAMTWLGPEMVFIPEQVLFRTRPTYFDLIIALAAGAAGAYTMTRKETSAIPGVAMAVALLPPLASSGILLVFAEYELSLRAMVLFVTNFFAMILAGTATFMATGMVPKKAKDRFSRFIRNSLVLFAILVGAISVPLFYYSNEVWYDARYAATKSPVIQNWLQENNLELERITIDEQEQIIKLAVSGPHPPLSLEELYEGLHKRKLYRGDNRDFAIRAKWIQSTLSSWPPDDEDKLSEREQKKGGIPKEIRGVSWHWARTQYADEDWLEPEHFDYRLAFVDGEELGVEISCKNLKGDYEATTDFLSINVHEPNIFNREPCDDDAMDNQYLNDLSRVVDFRQEEHGLVLELDNNAGFMLFVESPAETQ